MTPRQRRGVLLLFVAGIGAILVFSLISGYVSDVRKDVEPKTGVLVLTRAVPELQPIPPDAVALKSVPEKWVGRQALRDPSQIGSLVPNEPLPAGVELQQGMLVEPPALEKGQQLISILINADTGVAGNLRPGDMVDVLATFQPDDQTRSPASARTIIRRARIVTIGLPRAAARPGGRRQPAAPGQQRQRPAGARPGDLRPAPDARPAAHLRRDLRLGDPPVAHPPRRRDPQAGGGQARVHAAADAGAHAGAEAVRARLALGLTDSDRAAQVIALAEEAGDIDVVATPQTSDDVITVLAHTEVEVLVLDEELGPLPVLELARQLQAKHPAVGLLLLAAREASPDLLRQAVRAGFRDVLSAPMTVEALADATARGATWAQAVRERSESDELARVAEHIGGNMIAIAGAKGGVGCSTVALHVALAAARHDAERPVCLAELDLQTGDLRSLLDLQSHRSIADLASVAEGEVTAPLARRHPLRALHRPARAARARARRGRRGHQRLGRPPDPRRAEVPVRHRRLRHRLGHDRGRARWRSRWPRAR